MDCNNNINNIFIIIISLLENSAVHVDGFKSGKVSAIHTSGEVFVEKNSVGCLLFLSQPVSI